MNAALPLPTSVDLDHPLRHNVKRVEVDGLEVRQAVAADVLAGWVDSYTSPYIQTDEDGNGIIVRQHGDVVIVWDDEAQSFWNLVGGDA